MPERGKSGMTKILNLARLDRKLKRLPVLTKATIRTAMEGQAQIIVDLAKSLAPDESGALRESIGWTWGKAPKGSMVLGAVRSKLADDLTLTIYAGNDEAFYARWIEFGTAPHINGGLFEGSKHPGTNAQPFFYPAFRANRKGVKREIRKAVRNAAKQAARS